LPSLPRPVPASTDFPAVGCCGLGARKAELEARTPCGEKPDSKFTGGGGEGVYATVSMRLAAEDGVPSLMHFVRDCAAWGTTAGKPAPGTPVAMRLSIVSGCAARIGIPALAKPWTLWECTGGVPTVVPSGVAPRAPRL
jgi:hypothetical protein